MNHQHIKPTENINRAFVIGIVLNVGFVIIEAIFGFLTGSLALLADAGHNASDVLGLVLAWLANLLSKRPFNQTHTYGWRSSTIVAALLNALILLVAVGSIVKDAIGRLVAPQPGTFSAIIIWVALAGAAINLVSAFFFRSDRERDLNVQGAFIHMAADAGVSVGVAVAMLIIRATGWTWLDPVTGIVIAVIIFGGTWSLLRDSFHLLISGVPRNIDIELVTKYLNSLPGVENVHDLHVWGLSTREVALTAHLVKPLSKDDDQLISTAAAELHERFKIDHVTLQWERERLPDCM